MYNVYIYIYVIFTYLQLCYQNNIVMKYSWRMTTDMIQHINLTLEIRNIEVSSSALRSYNPAAPWTKSRPRAVAHCHPLLVRMAQKNTGWWFEPLWKIWKSIGMIIPNIWKIKVMFQTTNQNNVTWLMVGDGSCLSSDFSHLWMVSSYTKSPWWSWHVQALAPNGLVPVFSRSSEAYHSTRSWQDEKHKHTVHWPCLRFALGRQNRKPGTGRSADKAQRVQSRVS